MHHVPPDGAGTEHEAHHLVPSGLTGWIVQTCGARERISPSFTRAVAAQVLVSPATPSRGNAAAEQCCAVGGSRRVRCLPLPRWGISAPPHTLGYITHQKRIPQFCTSQCQHTHGSRRDSQMAGAPAVLVFRSRLLIPPSPSANTSPQPLPQVHSQQRPSSTAAAWQPADSRGAKGFRRERRGSTTSAASRDENFPVRRQLARSCSWHGSRSFSALTTRSR